jgi:hypothetical protein
MLCNLLLKHCIFGISSYVLFVILFIFLFQNIRIKKLRNDTGWVSPDPNALQTKTGELF